MKMHIAYLTPEFPGQTHAFIWRERLYLIENGVEVDIISTTSPPKAIKSQSWTKAAEAITTYLAPFEFKDFVVMVAELLRAGWGGWLRCVKDVLQAKGLSLVQRLRLAAIVLPATKLVHLARQQGWTHIHVHSCGESAHIAMFASHLSKITYSLSLLGPTLEQYGSNQEYKWKHASFGLAISKLLYNHVIKTLDSYLPPRVEFAVMAVDTDSSKRPTPYTPWEGGRPFNIFSCGRLNPVKGHSYLIEAVALLKQRGLDVHLQIAGEDDTPTRFYRKYLEQIIQERALESQVKLLGAISEDLFRQRLSEVDAFAMGSINEGISVAAMEAMSMEVPVIMTRVGGMHELIDSGVDGILVAPERADELAEAIAQVMLEPGFAMRLSHNSRLKVVEKFDSRLGAKVLLHNLEIVMNDKNSPNSEASVLNPA